MKHSILIISFVLLHTFLAWGQQEIYGKYASREDIDIHIAYVHDYVLDSSNALDLILIKANDSATWNTLLEELSVHPTAAQSESLTQGHDLLTFFTSDRHNLTAPPRGPSKCAITISHGKKEILILFIDTPEQNYKFWYHSLINISQQ